MDITISVLGFLTIGIEHEGNPIVVNAWNSNFSLFLIGYFIRHVVYLFLFLSSLLILLYLVPDFDSRKTKVLGLGVLLMVSYFLCLGLAHWSYSGIWLISIIFDGQIPNTLLYLMSIFLWVGMALLLSFVCLRRPFLTLIQN